MMDEDDRAMRSITLCPQCKGQTADTIIDGRRVCCFCGGDKGRAEMLEKWCKVCKRMTAHRLPEGATGPADAYCLICLEDQAAEVALVAGGPAEEARENILKGSGFSQRERDRLRFQLWLMGKGAYNDDIGE